jgi:hypothetical protein
MRQRHVTFALAAVLLGVVAASDALAAHGGGHSGGHVANGNHGHFGGGFAAPARFVPRAVFFPAPVVYLPAAYSYYPPPPDYYYPLSYYAPAQPLAYYQQYEQPVQSAPPPGGFYDPPRPAHSYPAANVEPSHTPIYFCKDASGRTSVTNRKEDMAGKDCGAQYGSASSAPSPKDPYAKR